MVCAEMLKAVIGSGRCGTNSITRFLNGQTRSDGRHAVARHETDWREIVTDLCRGREDLVDERLAAMPHDIEVSPFLLLMSWPPRSRSAAPLPPVGLLRDGRDTVRSGMTNGWYGNPECNPMHWVTLLPRFEGDRFERCCRYWTWACRRLAAWNATLFKLENMVRQRAERDRLLAALDLEASDRIFPRENRTLYELESMAMSAARPVSNAEVAWPNPFPPPERWETRWREVFARHCGEVMDDLYPGWDEARWG